MFAALKLWSPLLLGIVFIQLGNGLLTTSVGLRIDAAGFSPAAIAAVMSGFYAGQVLASLLSARFIALVRHVPAYVILAALTAVAPAAFLLGDDVVTWTAARFTVGFCLAGIFVAIESWLNDCVPNATRGRVFAAYILVQLGALLAAQFLVPPLAGHFERALLIVAVFGALAILPVAFSRTPRPSVRPHMRASLGALFAASPVGVAGAAVSGLVWAVTMAMAPIYAQRTGFDAEGVAVFVAAAVLGGLLLQWPLGWLSDLRDRRIVLAAISLLAAVAAVAGAIMGGDSHVIAVVAIMVFGGLTFPYYSIAVAHVNDKVDPAMRVATSGAMILLFGIGSIAGPSAASAAMEAGGPPGFFWLLAAATSAYGVYALYRLKARPSAPLETAEA
jgi:MFS family permease